MKITSTYSVRLRNFNRVFDDTVEVYRHAVDYFIELVIANWNTHFANLSRANGLFRLFGETGSSMVPWSRSELAREKDAAKFPS